MNADPWLFMVAFLSDAAATRVLIETVIGRSSGRVFKTTPVTDADPGLADYVAAPVWKALAAECALHRIEETPNDDGTSTPLRQRHWKSPARPEAPPIDQESNL